MGWSTLSGRLSGESEMEWELSRSGVESEWETRSHSPLCSYCDSRSSLELRPTFLQLIPPTPTQISHSFEIDFARPARQPSIPSRARGEGSHAPGKMPPHTLASLAHALSAATDLDAAFVALGEGLAETDRGAHVALFRLDAKRAMLRERALVVDGAIQRVALEASLEQFAKNVGRIIAEGSLFADLAEESPGFARMLAMPRASGG